MFPANIYTGKLPPLFCYFPSKGRNPAIPGYLSSYLRPVADLIFDSPSPEDSMGDGAGIQGFSRTGLTAALQGWHVRVPWKHQRGQALFHFPDLFDSVRFLLYERYCLCHSSWNHPSFKTHFKCSLFCEVFFLVSQCELFLKFSLLLYLKKFFFLKKHSSYCLH